eukprot:COSAG01_NODE_48484_length_381_cov_0.407801_2_plen_34_part_01
MTLFPYTTLVRTEKAQAGQKDIQCNAVCGIDHIP